MLINNTFFNTAYNTKQHRANQYQSRGRRINVQFNAAVNYNPQRYSPLFSCELERLQVPAIFNKIRMFKRLNPMEMKQCYHDIISFLSDSGCFFTTIMGYKPACLINGKYNNLSYLEKVDYAVPIDIVNAGPANNPDFCNSYVINPKEAKKVIEQNKIIYTRRLNLPDNTNIDEVYSKVKQELAKNNRSIIDLEGILLGFPKYSSMIFMLENMSCAQSYRSNVKLHRMILFDTLHSENSPYKNLPINEINKLDEILSTECIRQGDKNPYFQYVKYTEEPIAENDIFQKARNFNGSFSADDIID